MPNVFPEKMKAEVKELNFYYDHLQALKNVNLPISQITFCAQARPPEPARAQIIESMVASLAMGRMDFLLRKISWN